MANAQTPPVDFHFTATVGGLGTWSQNRTITIDSSGYVTFKLYNSETAPLVLAETSYTVSPADLQRLWRSLQDHAFSTLNPSYADTTFAEALSH